MSEEKLNEEISEEDDIVELEDEDGKTAQFHHVATIDYKNDWYVCFSPVGELDGLGEDEIIIFKLGTDEEGNDLFLPIEDDILLEEVYNEYVSIMESDDDDACTCGDIEDEEDGCSCGCDSCKGHCGEDKE